MTNHPDQPIIEGLRRRDEAVFRRLVATYHRSLMHVARQFVATDSVAEEVVQETWLAVVKGIDRFEGNSSLKTWIFRILQNQARTRGAREQRITPLSSLGDGTAAVDPERFLTSGPFAGHWAAPPKQVSDLPPECLEGREVARVLEAAIQVLPEMQKRVLWLRDVEGWSSDEVCEAFDLSEGNQRVLLHRARSKVRSEFERYASKVSAS